MMRSRISIRVALLAILLTTTIGFGFVLRLSAGSAAAPPLQITALQLTAIQPILSTSPAIQPIQSELIVPLATPTRTPTPINLGNFVWDDIDHDGRQDVGEPGLSGVTVQLWNVGKTQLIAQTTTNVSGAYTVVAPVPGQYRVRVLLPSPSDTFSPKDQAGGDDTNDSDINVSGINAGFTDTITIAPNVISISNIDAGIIKFRTPTPTRTPTPINLGNFVWDDIDHDGRQDVGEPGLNGVTVQLWNAAKTQLIAQTTTNANGAYSLVAPLPGEYRVRVLLPSPSDTFSPKDQAGGDDTDDSDINVSGINTGFTDTITIAPNVISITNIDAGIIKFRTPTPTRTPTPINLGNRVWRDLNQDGRQDVDEPGVNGVTVQLWNAAKTQLIAQTTTNPGGIYTVVAPLPGQYRVRVLLPSPSYTFSPKNQAGGDDTEDSDINVSGINTGFTDIISIASNVISISNIDAGLIGEPINLNPPGVLVNPGALVTVGPPLVLDDVCERFRLTSPLDGLPDGTAAFFWDPASASNVTYQVSLLDEAGNLLATFEAGEATAIQQDVSMGRIGGGFQVRVRVMALRDGQALCVDERVILRAAPVGDAPSASTPTPRRR